MIVSLRGQKFDLGRGKKNLTVYKHTHITYKQTHSMSMALKFHRQVKSQPPIKTCLGLFPIPPNNALISAGYLMIRLNYDTIYLEIASTPKG